MYIMDDDYWAQVIEPDEVGGVLSEEDARKDFAIQDAITLLTDNGYIVIEKAPF